ncbi:MAG: hypothetical protein KBC48_01825 [Candidatus Pacebacteria bacterium]|nr:hypothetical protein [Candidatus Paceibacterota bacterium]
MSRNIRCSKGDAKKSDTRFLQERIKRLMQVSEGRWIARTIGCSPALIYQWNKPKPRSLPTPNHIWKISSIEAVLFELDKVENFKVWLKACGYEIEDEMVKAHLKWIEMQGEEITIKFPSLGSNQSKPK